MTAYTAKATREGGWWALYVPELDLATQSRRLDQAEGAVRDLITTWLEVPVESFDVSVTHHLDEVTRRSLDQVRQKQEISARAAETASAALRTFARRLQDQGYTVRDIGAILGVSAQRASQLTTGAQPVPTSRTSSVQSVSASLHSDADATTAAAMISRFPPTTRPHRRSHRERAYAV